MKYYLTIIVILSCLIGCTTISTNQSKSTAEEADLVFNTPASSDSAKSDTLYIINITSEPTGCWLVVDDDRLGKTPFKLGVYGTRERRFFHNMHVEIKSTAEMEAALPDNLSSVNFVGGNKIFFGYPFGVGGDHIPRNLHLELHTLDRDSDYMY